MAVLVALIARGAAAASFDDFNQGLAARGRGDFDTEITDFNKALSAGDLVPALRVTALYDRGEAYAHEKKFAEAIADLSAVLKQSPDHFDALKLRTVSYEASERFAEALADCEALTLLRPNTGSFLRSCGRLAFQAGQHDRASDYFRRAIALNGADRQVPYDLLWLGLTSLKRGKLAGEEMPFAAVSLDWGAWPSPLIAFFRGQISEDAVKTAAASGNDETRRNQECEVGFYVGEWELAYRNVAAAKTLFQQAVNLCPNSYIEFGPVRTELKKLT